VGETWLLEMQGEDGLAHVARARALVNAAGPWVEDVLQRITGLNSSHSVRLVKGSHIVVPKFWAGSHAYLFQNDDRRVIFVNPYQGDLALVGTTDIPYEGRAEDVAIDGAETQYLLRAVSRYVRTPPNANDIIHAFSGVRPLYDDSSEDPSAVTRDYVLEIDGPPGMPPVLSIFGGKITTYRKLAEHALWRLMPWFPLSSPAWTADARLPGGDIPGSFEDFVVDLQREYSGLPDPLIRHYSRLYGTRTRELLGAARTCSDLGRHFGGDFYEREARYLRETEWATHAADVLDRRTKHGLHLTSCQRAAFEDSIGK
jgi:glycerol-3-phosphate dehydrogenase